VNAALATLQGTINTALSAASAHGNSGLAGVLNTAKGQVAGVQSTFSGALSQVTGTIASVPSTVASVPSTVAAIPAQVSGVAGQVTGTVQGGVPALPGVGSTTDAVTDTVTGAVDTVTGAVGGLPGTVTGTVSGLTDQLTGTLGGLLGDQGEKAGVRRATEILGCQEGDDVGDVSGGSLTQPQQSAQKLRLGIHAGVVGVALVADFSDGRLLGGVGDGSKCAHGGHLSCVSVPVGAGWSVLSGGCGLGGGQGLDPVGSEA
jgi:hypothetical protein